MVDLQIGAEKYSRSHEIACQNEAFEGFAPAAMSPVTSKPASKKPASNGTVILGLRLFLKDSVNMHPTVCNRVPLKSLLAKPPFPV